MHDPLALAQNSIPPLHVLIDDLINLSEQIGHSDVTINNPATDPSAIPGAMAISYASKQNEHLRSVRLLVRAGQHRDAYLIARTMAEGMIQFKWALTNVPDGPETWYHYGYIEDWRQLEKQRTEGKAIDPTLDALAKQQLAKHGATYEDPRKSKERIASSDPYRDKWNNLSAWQMFEQMQSSDLYEGLYRDVSAWIHRSPRAIYLAMVDLGDRTRYEIDDPRRAAVALAGGAMSLLYTLQLLNWYFKLSYEAGLAQIENGLLQITSTLPNEM